MFLHIALPLPDCRKMAGRTSRRQRGSRRHNLPTPGDDAIGNPSAGYRESKMLVALREDPVTFL